MRRAYALGLVVSLSACATILGLDAGEARDGVDAAARDGAEPDAPGPGSDGGQTTDGTAEGSSSDVGVSESAATDGLGPPPRVEPQITCGAAECIPGLSKCELACGTTRMQTCQPWNVPLSASCGLALCDDTADCTAMPGTACCARAPSGVPDLITAASCRPCTDAGEAQLCDPGKPDCPAGKQCKPWFGYAACL